MPEYVKETIRMDSALAVAVAARATQLGIPIQAFVLYAVIRYMDDRTPMPSQPGEEPHL